MISAQVKRFYVHKKKVTLLANQKLLIIFYIKK